MIDDYLIYLLKTVGKFFINPLFYFLIFTAWFIGLMRIKRERKQFSSKVSDFTVEFRTALVQGLLVSLALSIVFVGLGLVLDKSFFILLTYSVLIMCLTMKWKYLSPIFTIGTILILSITSVALNKFHNLNYLPRAFNEIQFQEILVVLGIMLMAEAVLILRHSWKNSSPTLLSSKRGKTVGAHTMDKLWILPIFFLIPGDIANEITKYWPVIPTSYTEIGIILFPFPVGFQMIAQGDIPKFVAKSYARKVITVSIICLILAGASFYYPIISIGGIALVTILYVYFSIKARYDDSLKAPYFSYKNRGLVILSVMKNSTADKMKLKVGEILVKVNGVEITSVKDLYEALNLNRAYVKLEVIDEEGQIRLVNRAIYEEDHHELGIVGVKNMAV
jgi:hypothetical protein